MAIARQFRHKGVMGVITGKRLGAEHRLGRTLSSSRRQAARGTCRGSWSHKYARGLIMPLQSPA